MFIEIKEVTRVLCAGSSFRFKLCLIHLDFKYKSFTMLFRKCVLFPEKMKPRLHKRTGTWAIFRVVVYVRHTEKTASVLASVTGVGASWWHRGDGQERRYEEAGKSALFARPRMLSER